MINHKVIAAFCFKQWLAHLASAERRQIRVNPTTIHPRCE